jgi:hypothetical protein
MEENARNTAGRPKNKLSMKKKKERSSANQKCGAKV